MPTIYPDCRGGDEYMPPPWLRKFVGYSFASTYKLSVSHEVRLSFVLPVGIVGVQDTWR